MLCSDSHAQSGEGGSQVGTAGCLPLLACCLPAGLIIGWPGLGETGTARPPAPLRHAAHSKHSPRSTAIQARVRAGARPAASPAPGARRGRIASANGARSL